MSEFKSIDEARDFFKNDRFATDNGMTVEELGEDWCVCAMDVTDGHRNAVGGIMGGVIFTLGDFAFAVAANQVHRTTVALQTSMNFMSASRGKRLFAKATCAKNGRTTCVYNVDVTDDMGRAVAQIVVTGYKQ